jgi:hypothetical protein
MILDASPQEDRPDDMNRVPLQNEALIEIDVGIGQIDCQYRIVIAQVGPEQQRLHAIQQQLQPGKIAGIRVENSVLPAGRDSDVAMRL